MKKKWRQDKWQLNINTQGILIWTTITSSSN